LKVLEFDVDKWARTLINGSREILEKVGEFDDGWRVTRSPGWVTRIDCCLTASFNVTKE